MSTAEPKLGRGRRTSTGPHTHPTILPGETKPLPRLIKAHQAAALKGMPVAEFLRLSHSGLTPRPIPRQNGAGPDRWRIDAIKKWEPEKLTSTPPPARPVVPTRVVAGAPARKFAIHPKPVALRPGVFHLYRHFDSEGALLYVGISLAAISRQCDHRRLAGWFWQVARIEIMGYETLIDAQIAERTAIYRERPLHNIAHARKSAPSKSPAKRREAAPAQLIPARRASTEA